MRKRRIARGAASVVVVGVDPRGMGLIRECLGTEAVLPTNSTPYADTPQVVNKTRPNVVIMGFDGDFDEAVRLGPVLAAEVRGLHMVAFSQRTDPERIRAAMRAGYREYVVLPEDADLLRKAVHESAFGAKDDEEQGEVVAMVGTKGGSGVSFLAVNLAAELSPVHRVCVVDMDFSMGDVAAFLDLQPAKSIYDVIHNLSRLDQRMLAGSVVVHPSKVHVLAQPTELVDRQEIHGDDILRILTATAEAYQFVLVDCGGRVDETTLTATSVADMVLLVCTPDVVAVKNAWRRLQMMERLGVPKDTVRLVVNKWPKASELSIADIEKNLDVPVSVTITADAAACQRAVNIGKLLRDVEKRSPTARDISSAVEIITAGVTKVTGTPVARPFWNLFK